MKGKTLIIAVICVCVTGASSHAINAAGSSFGNLMTADAAGMGHGSFQGGVGIADFTSVFGAFRYGFSDYTEGRVKLGLADEEGTDASFVLGADFKYQFWNVTPKTENPFDMAFGGFFEFVDFDFGSILQVGGKLIGSYPLQLRNGGVLSPYGAFNIRLESLDLDRPAFGGGGGDSNIEFGLHGGVHWQATSTVGLFGEFQLDGNDGLFFGVDFSAL